MLELRNVCKRFSGIAAVDDVSFQARAGEITGYLGPNGSGKSTTMKMITGLLETTSGKILFAGEFIGRDLIAYKQRMGYVPEEPHLYAHLSGLEYLAMVGQLRGLPAKPTATRIDGLLRLFSLHGDRHVPISAYSKGMRQKVLLSGALLHNPDLILLDEPYQVGVVQQRRSEEHTSELQSRFDLVCRLLLEKKNITPRRALCHLPSSSATS